MEVLTHSEIFDTWSRTGDSTTQDARWKRLRTLVRRGELIVVGRDSYVWAEETNLRPYRPVLSDVASQVRSELSEKYGRMNFTLFELGWLNDFLNHLLARNAVFVMVERAYAPFVFEFLNAGHAGDVLLDPTVDDFLRYANEHKILVVKKPSQGPVNRLLPHIAPPEQWLADLLADRRISSSFEGTELSEIFSSFGSRYVVNKSALLRYARRRGVADRVGCLLKGENG